MRIVAGFLAAVVCAGAAVAAEWSEPPRGSAERAALMDALRPHAEWELGAPVEFVVHELRMAGDVAYASLIAQRPGGAEIDILQTPMHQRGEADTSVMDGATMQALYVRSGQTWVAVHWAIGATDVWFAYGPFCRRYGAVIADYCVGVAD